MTPKLGVFGTGSSPIPVILTALVFLWLRADKLGHGPIEIVAVVIALSWSWAGPSLIWNYENNTLPEFDKNCRSILTEQTEYAAVRNCIYSSIYRLKFCIIFTAVWFATIGVVLIFSRKFLFDFGLLGYSDPFFWIGLVGAALFTFYSSLGFCFAFKTAYLISLISKCKLDVNVYHFDRTLGLSFIVKFARKTNLTLLIGWLFAPIILLASQDGSVQKYMLLIMLLGFYPAYNLLTFAFPIFFIHRRIVAERNSISNRLYLKTKSLLEGLTANFSEREHQEFSFYRNQLLHLNTISNWPLLLDVRVAFNVFTLIFSTVVVIIKLAF